MIKYILNLLSPYDQEVINKLKSFNSEENLEKFLEFSDEVYKNIKTIENNEPLLFLKEHLCKDIQIKLCNRNIPNIDDNKRLFLRKTVVNKLNKAQKLLPKGYNLAIRDAFRSEKIVWYLYNFYCKALKEKKPSLTEKEIDIMVRSKLAMPDDLIVPGHMTGGAVDLALANDAGDFIKTRIEGTDMINSPEHQYTFNKNIPKEMYKNRMILYKTMKKVGFTNFFREYWHYSYGDGYWAMQRKKKIAIYGIPKINK